MKIALFGLGHLGKIHARCLLATNCWEVVGFCDPNDDYALQAEAELGIKRFKNAKELMQLADAVDIVTTTQAHYKIAAQAIRLGKHVFLEKPVTETLRQAKLLLDLTEKHQVKVQVGHVERFNPAVLALEGTPVRPMFIECHRLAIFQPRGTDVSVVLDLMIHDLDMVLHLVKSPVKKVHANGVAILSPSPDIANVRLEFENGCTANLTASRVSLKQMRKLRIFQSDAYISLDFLEKNAQIIRLYETEKQAARIVPDNVMQLDTPTGKKFMTMQMPETEPTNAIQRELEAFHEAISKDETPVVTLKDGYEALRVAHWVLKEIKR